jgi:hypothetical protein
MDRNDDANGEFRFAEEGCADPAMPEVRRNRVNTEQALAYMANNPLKEAQLVVLRTFRMFQDDHTGLEEVEANGAVSFGDEHSGGPLAHLADAFFYAVGALAIVGVVLERRRLWATPQRVLVLATALALLIIPIGLWGNRRFHVPLLPFMAMAAAVGLGAVTNRSRRGDTV